MSNGALAAPEGMITLAGTVALSVRLLFKLTSRDEAVLVLRVTVPVIAGFRPSAATSCGRSIRKVGPSSSVTVRFAPVPSAMSIVVPVARMKTRNVATRSPSTRLLLIAGGGKEFAGFLAGITRGVGAWAEPGALLVRSSTSACEVTGVLVTVAIVADGPAPSLTVLWARVSTTAGRSLSIIPSPALAATNPEAEAVMILVWLPVTWVSSTD